VKATCRSGRPRSRTLSERSFEARRTRWAFFVLPNPGSLQQRRRATIRLVQHQISSFAVQLLIVLSFLITWTALSFGQTAGSTQTFNSSISSPELDRRDQPVTADDLKILNRANQILSTPTAWNRHDMRICKPSDHTWSLFCALQMAAVDVLGKESYRAVAIQEVRFVTEDLMKGMNVPVQHRLTDYNNLRTTRFEDIKRVLKVATDRVSARLAAQGK
jgi:hypothetical protein